MYLSSGTHNPGLCGSGTEEELQAEGCQPDITRVIDEQETGADNRTVRVTAMDRASFQDTDIFIIREATGAIVMMRQGLKDSESAAMYMGEASEGTPDYEYILGGSGEIVSSNQRLLTRYRMLMRGGDDVSYSGSPGSVNAANFSEWQAKGNIAPQFHGIDSDLVKPGETLLIYAINRVTGYMGYQRVLTDQLAGATLDTQVSAIVMYPPNLKVWAERKYTIEAGNNQGETPEYLIGYEGAGEADDTVIQIYTDWTAPDGTAIPTALQDYGYTGRVAYSSGEHTLADASQAGVARFKIEPGTHAQVIQLPGNDTAGNQHFYVQAFGVPYGEFQDFALGQQSRGLSETDLQGVEENAWRPKFFVPVKVPVYDEANSLIQEQAFELYKKSLREQQASGEQTDVDPDTLDDPDPIYSWMARPEYQFSVYDLDVTAINVKETDDEGNVETVNLLEDENAALSSESSLEILYALYGSDNDGLQLYQSEDQTLILNVGGNETEVTVTDNGSLEFSDPSALIGLSGDDLLSVSLYTNNDSVNVLWQWAYEYIWLEPLYAGMDVQSDVLYVSADDTEVPLEAVLVGYADRSVKNPLKMKWTLSGPGILAETTQTDDDQGIFDNTLTLPTSAGSRAVVSVELEGESGTEKTLPPFQVLPGEPAIIAVQQSGEVSINGHGEVTLTYTVMDQFGNLVADGTGVSVGLDNALELVSADNETTSGRAQIKVKGAETAGLANVTFQAGLEVQDSEIEVKPLLVTWPNAQVAYKTGTRISDNLLVTDLNGAPVGGAEVTLTSTYGLIQNTRLVTNAEGQAFFQMTLPDSEGVGNLSASIGFEFSDLGNYDVEHNSAQLQNLDSNNAVVIGDQISPGQIEYTRYDGEVIAIGYDTSTYVNLFGSPNQAVTVTLGDMHDPNIPALTAFGQLYGGTLIDKAGYMDMDASGVKSVHDTPIGAGTSLQFLRGNSSLLSTDDVSRLPLSRSLGVNLAIKPQTGGGTLVDLENGLFRVVLNGSGTISASIETEDGNYSVTSTNAATYGQWHDIAVRYHQGQLQLWLDDQMFEVAAAGNLGRHTNEGSASSTSTDMLSPEIQPALIVGKDYSGNIHRMKWFDWSAEPLLTFDNHQSELVTQIDQNGSARVSVSSTGRLHANNSSVDIQRVAITSGGTRQFVTLVSTDTFQRLAGLYSSTLGTDTLPINEVGLAANQSPSALPLSGVFPQAHAFSVQEFAWGTVSFLLPIEDAGILVEQIVNLITNREAFDPAEFIIATINVLTVLPPAKLLTPFVKPASKFIRAMKAVNPKFLTSMGGVFLKVLHRSKRFDFDLLLQTLPFVVIAAELYNDPEAAAGLTVLVNSITSAEDAINWIEYLSLPSDGWEGDEAPIVDALASNELNNSLPLSFMFNQAYAANPVKKLDTAAMIKLFKGVGKHIPAADLENVGKAVSYANRAVRSTSSPSVRKAVHTKYFLQLAIASARRSAQNAFEVMTKGHKYTRLSTAAIIGTLGYLEYEANCGRLTEQGSKFYDSDMAEDLNCGSFGFNAKLRKVYYDNVIAAFANATRKKMSQEKQTKGSDGSTDGGDTDPQSSADNKGTKSGDRYGHGALFHLHEMAKYQLQYRAGGMKLLDSEAHRVIGLFPDQDVRDFAKDKGFERNGKIIHRIRRVDIVLQDDDQKEHWIELKSLKSRKSDVNAIEEEIRTWTVISEMDEKKKKNKEEKDLTAYNRQASLDRAAYNQGIAWRKLSGENLYDPSTMVDVASYQWVFQKFKSSVSNPANSGRSPELGDINKPASIRYKLSKTPNLPRGVKQYPFEQAAVNDNYIYSGFDQVKSQIKAYGFDIVDDAIDVEVINGI